MTDEKLHPKAVSAAVKLLGAMGTAFLTCCSLASVVALSGSASLVFVVAALGLGAGTVVLARSGFQDAQTAEEME